MYSPEEILKQVQHALEHLPLDKEPQGLYAPIRYVLSIGGKRIRPVLMLLTYNLYRDDIERIMPLAVGLETYHNYTLLHDDLMDHADKRRGMPTVHKKWDANTAILSGDSMLVMAYQLMLAAPAEVLAPVLQLFTKTALEIGEGQQYDMDFETRRDVREEDYLEMIRLKTSVLLACAMKTGALAAGASEDDARLLYAVGEQVGLAFQLQDDLLDVFGDPAVFGKNIGGDILCNKKTYLLIKCLEQANDVQRNVLNGWLDATDYDAQEKIKAVTALYEATGVKAFCTDKINAYFDAARKNLDEVSLPQEKKEILWQFMLRLLNRKS